MSTTTTAAAQEGQPHRPGGPELQGRQDHAVRRLRPQRHLRAHHRVLLRDGRASPGNVAKFSGIGCSSKSPAYFLSLSHGFNAVHGRMPSVATGAMLANRTMHGHRRDRRRRHRLHRHRPVHAPAAPQSAADLHHRRQRRLRTDQGPILGHRRSRLQAEDRRDQRSAAVRLLRAGAEVGRHLRGPLVLRRQETACRRS